MAFSRAFLLSLVLSFVLLALLQSHPTIAETTTGPIGTKAAINCVGACNERCSKSWKPKMCKKLCTGCCNKCGCAPAGPSVSRESACSCYAQLRNPKTGAFKCP